MKIFAPFFYFATNRLSNATWQIMVHQLTKLHQIENSIESSSVSTYSYMLSASLSSFIKKSRFWKNYTRFKKEKWFYIYFHLFFYHTRWIIINCTTIIYTRYPVLLSSRYFFVFRATNSIIRHTLSIDSHVCRIDKRIKYTWTYFSLDQGARNQEIERNCKTAIPRSERNSPANLDAAFSCQTFESQTSCSVGHVFRHARRERTIIQYVSILRSRHRLG